MSVRTNYFKGNDPQQRHTDVARFEHVRYAQVYPGVDLIYYGQQQLEYDFEVAPVEQQYPCGNIRELYRHGALKLSKAGILTRARLILGVENGSCLESGFRAG